MCPWAAGLRRGAAWASTVRFGPVLKSVRHEGMIEQIQILLDLDWELDFNIVHVLDYCLAADCQTH